MKVDFQQKADAYLASVVRALHQGLDVSATSADQWAQGLDALVAPELPQPSEDYPLVFRHPLSGEPLNPCSGTRLDKTTDALTLGDIRDTANATLDQAIAELTADVQDAEPRFLTLWRHLPEKVQELAETVEMRRLWALLPGDRVVPDHTAWQRAATASAFLSALPRPALLLFTIASVQDFVREARRTQDFWMGSFLVSYLMWAAMGPVVDRLGPDAVLMPDLRGQPLVDDWLQKAKGVLTKARTPDSIRLLQTATLPNVFTAVVPAEDGKDLAQEAEKAVHQAKNDLFKQVRAYVEEAVGESDLAHLVREANRRENRALASKTQEWLLDRLADLSNDSDWCSIWKRQATHFLDFHLFWAVLPWPDGGLKGVLDLFERNCRVEAESPVRLAEELLEGGDDAPDGGGGYHLVSELAGRLLAARKELRHFPQVDEPGHKCSQCGLREALHPSWPTPPGEGEKQRDTYAELRLFWESLALVSPKAEKGKLKGRIRPGDRLCAVCLVKRLVWEAVLIERLGLEDLRGEMHIPFPSTATLAAAPFKGEVLEVANRDTAVRDKLRNYVKAVGGLLNEYDIPFASRVPPLLEQNKETALSSGLDKGIANTFLRLDGDWLYEESFAPERIRREHGVEAENREHLRSLAQEGQSALHELLEAMEEHGARASDTVGVENGSAAQSPSRPARYYAVLYLDADHFGEWVSGVRGPAYLDTLSTGVLERLRDPLSPSVLPANTLARLSDRRFAKALTPLRHRATAEAVKFFALETARRIAEERYYGVVLYSGGDDLRVLLPLKGLLRLMDELERVFRGSPFEGSELTAGHGLVSRRGQFHLAAGAPWRDDDGGITVSAGVCIAHQDYPLRLVMRETEEAEEEAKEAYGRNAFSIHLLKRSGGAVSLGGPWQLEQQGPRVLEKLDQAREAFRAGLSPRILHQMRAEAAGMSAVPQESWEAEWSRLLSAKEKPPASADLEGTVSLLMRGYAGWSNELSQKARNKQANGPKSAWSWAADLLEVAEFLAREE